MQSHRELTCDPLVPTLRGVEPDHQHDPYGFSPCQTDYTRWHAKVEWGCALVVREGSTPWRAIAHAYLAIVPFRLRDFRWAWLRAGGV